MEDIQALFLPLTEDNGGYDMTMHSWTVADAARPISQDGPATAAGQLARFWRWLAACRCRAAERRELRELVASQALYDLSPKRVREEAAKPFWVE